MQTNTLNLEITIFSFRYLDSVEDLACKDYPLVKLLRIISMQSLGYFLNIYLYNHILFFFSSNNNLLLLLKLLLCILLKTSPVKYYFCF